MVRLSISDEIMEKLHVTVIYSDDEEGIQEDFLQKKIPFSDSIVSGIVLAHPINFIVYHKCDDGSKIMLDVITGINQIETVSSGSLFHPLSRSHITISIEEINNALSICGSGGSWDYNTEQVGDMVYKMIIY